ncbi:hypothetical protein DFH28DRAFT_1126454 [Melampsora americana]|nr:hypothetical protein DFH28DRAFT_1126454 [Melampsora americana]
MLVEEIIHPQDKLQNQWELWTPEENFLQNQEDAVMIAAAEIEEANAESTSNAVEVVRPTTKEALNYGARKYLAQVRSKLMLTAQQSSITHSFTCPPPLST